MPTPWDYCTRTHFAPIDEEHREVVELIAALVEAMDGKKREAVRPAMDAVCARVTAHFAHEEQLMAECAHARAGEHQKAHATFLQDLRAFDAELRANGPTEKFRLWAAGRLGKWFQLHIRTYDIGLAKALIVHRRGGEGAGST